MSLIVIPHAITEISPYGFDMVPAEGYNECYYAAHCHDPCWHSKALCDHYLILCQPHRTISISIELETPTADTKGLWNCLIPALSCSQMSLSHFLINSSDQYPVHNMIDGITRMVWTPCNVQLIETEWRIYASVKSSSLIQIMASRPVGAKPLPKPMLSYCQSDA